MLEIDGAQGEGGGQILRSSVALAGITGTAIRITNIRAGRRKPGLKRQHVTAVEAAAAVCGAETSGVEPRSEAIEFVPGPLRGGEFSFDLGTAGSTTLVLQTVLPMLLHATDPSRLVLSGGTHNPFAPPFDFLQKAFAPLLTRMGAEVRLTLQRAGFYPAGGGVIEADVSPAGSLQKLDLLERGKRFGTSVRAIVSNLPRHIAERECEVVCRQLGLPAKFAAVEDIPSDGPGNVVLVELQFEKLTELFVGFGEKGVPAERIARRVARATEQYLKSDVPVGEYLADQLLLPLALGAHVGTGGGAFRTGPLSLHARTHIDILSRFLDADVAVSETDSGVIVRVD